MTYQVSLLNSAGKTIFTHRYDDSDGILDLELIPHRSKNATDFITWGPDFRSQESLRTTGTFHVKGPVLVADLPYYIKVAIVSQDNKAFSKPLVDTFLLPQQLGLKASALAAPATAATPSNATHTTAAPSNTTSASTNSTKNITKTTKPLIT